ncbi:hemagglutinin repeat-containing protein, partial [Collimonas silvisoli]|uniref:hemagglutinin repeat-containing protein n=1 Tax=Collimonas silvisoli TaxID=2825884 RepID=UPI001B8D059B
IGLNDVSLTATDGKVAIVSVQDTSQTNSTHEQKKSGFTASFSAGVASIGYGKASANSQNSEETVTQQGSSIASINGNTRIQAGQQLSVVASDISAGNNLTLIGKSVDLSAAQNTSVEHGAQQSSSSGLSVGVTLNPLAAFKSAYQQSASGNPSTSFMGRASKYGDAIGDGTLAASTPVV